MAINTITLTPPLFLWPLHCLSFDIRLLITPLLYLHSFLRESCCSIFRGFCVQGFVQHCLSFSPISLHHCIFCPSNYVFWFIPFWYILYIQTISISVSLKKWEKNHFDNRLCWAPMNLRHSVVCQTALSRPSASSKWYLLKWSRFSFTLHWSVII